MTTRNEVYKVIDAEREFQNKRYAGRHHEVGAYLTLLRNYISKAEEGWVSGAGDLDALNIIRKIAGIAVHCMEEHGALPRLPYDK